MAKIRVYELATQMGLDNKDVVEKLQQAGIEVKNHMSAVEEDIAQKFEAEHAGKKVEAPEAEENVEVKVKEERISSGLIRRRRKTVVKEEPVVAVAEAPAEVPVEEEAATEAPVEEEGVAEEVTAEAAEEVQAEPKTEETVEAEAQLEKTDQTAPKKKAKKEPVRAKILGRVELPTPAEGRDVRVPLPKEARSPRPANVNGRIARQLVLLHVQLEDPQDVPQPLEYRPFNRTCLRRKRGVQRKRKRRGATPVEQILTGRGARVAGRSMNLTATSVTARAGNRTVRPRRQKLPSPRRSRERSGSLMSLRLANWPNVWVSKPTT